MAATVELHLPSSPSPGQVIRLCARLRRRLGDGGVRHVVCDVDGLAADVGAVEALARLALTARRGGAALQVRGASADLRSLLRLVGLYDALIAPPADAVEAALRKACPGAPPVRTVSGALIVLSSGGTP